MQIKYRWTEGLPVVDAKKPVVIHVTKTDVTKGQKAEPEACAMAQACMRELKVARVRINIGRTYILFGKVWHRYKTPASIAREIVSFDRGATFEPGTYRIAPVMPSLRLGVAKKRKKTAPPKVKNPKKAPHKMTYHLTANVRRYKDK